VESSVGGDRSSRVRIWYCFTAMEFPKAVDIIMINEDEW
jgi:hypothetical protein